MKRLNYLVVLSIFAALILAMIAIFPASAAKPDNFVIPLSGYEDYFCNEGFGIRYGWDGAAHIIIDWDEDAKETPTYARRVMSIASMTHRRSIPQIGATRIRYSASAQSINKWM